jgi:putative ABC transport system permease protein
MFRIALRALAAHKLRTFLTTLAILLGVAMISGTYVLTDQIHKGFDQVFADAYKGTDVTITRKMAFTGAEMAGATAGLPQGMVDQVRAIDGVAAADGSVGASGAVAVNGKVVQTGGSPTLFFSHEASLSSTKFIEGKPPSSTGQVGIIEKLAKDKHLTVGSHITVITDNGSQDATVSGVFRFGAESSLGGSILIVTTLQDAQQWFDSQGRVSSIDVRATPGVSPQTLADRITAALPKYADVKTGAQAAADQTKQVSQAINSFLQPVLLAFGGVAVLVGAFIIFNAFSMTVAQRRREFAMLRALGASRRQVLLSIGGESLVMGVFASLLGLLAGLAVAAGINALFTAMNIDIPRSGLVMQPRTVVVALVVGVTVTVLSAMVPALRATRVPPVAALQRGAALPPSRFSRYTDWAAIAVAVLGGLFIAGGMFAGGSTTQRLLEIALGAVLVFVALAMLAKHFVKPVAGAVGAPLSRLSPTSGRLARDNTMRNPSRTAATAAALMIGLGVVVFVAVFAQGLKSSFVDSFDQMVNADFVITGGNFLALPTDATQRAESVSTVQDVAGIDAQQVQTGNKKLAVVYAADPFALSRLWNFDWISGSDAQLQQLGTNGVMVEQQTAKTIGAKVGKTITLTTVDGTKAKMKVEGEYRDPVMLNGLLMTSAGYRALFPKEQLFMVLASTVPGTSEAQAKQQLDAALKAVPTAEVKTAAEYKDSIVGQVNQLLNLLYGLLAMSVIISLFGIVNTLVLSVYERTREIGLLRAIGASRRQIRSSVRYESVITSIIGGLLGILVGIVFAYVITARFGSQGIVFSVPWLQLVVFLVVAVIVGVLAAILPARRAARIDILEAISYE